MGLVLEASELGVGESVGDRAGEGGRLGLLVGAGEHEAGQRNALEP